MRGDNTKRRKARHSGKRQKPYPHEISPGKHGLLLVGMRSGLVEESAAEEASESAATEAAEGGV